MNIRDLKYLVAVAECRHFSKAAELCFVSQPALSMQLKKLEDTLGVQLIERTQRSVLITEVGQLVVAQAKEILRNVTAIKNIAQQSKNPFAGKLSMGIIPTLAPYVLPHIIAPIQQAFPELILHLDEDKTAAIQEKLLAGTLDCALLALPFSDEHCVAQPVFDEPFLLAVAADHALAKRKKITVADLSSYALLLLDEGHCLRDQALQVCHQANALEVLNFRATSLETLRYMIMNHVGITLMPALACQPHEKICYLAFPSPAPKRTIGLVWRCTSAREAVYQAIAEKITDTMKEVQSIR